MPRRGHAVGCRATGKPQRAETDGGAEQKRPAVEKPRPKPKQSCLVYLAGVGDLTVHDHDFGISHVLLPDQRIFRHAPVNVFAELRLPSHGSIGKLKPSLRGACQHQSRYVHAVSQSHFARASTR